MDDFNDENNDDDNTDSLKPLPGIYPSTSLRRTILKRIQELKAIEKLEEDELAEETKSLTDHHNEDEQLDEAFGKIDIKSKACDDNIGNDSMERPSYGMNDEIADDTMIDQTSKTDEPENLEFAKDKVDTECTICNLDENKRGHTKMADEAISKEKGCTPTEQLSASPTSFLDYTDDDDDDDDDLLHTAPAFLKSIQEITNRPSPEPKAGHLSNLNMSIDSTQSSPISQKSQASDIVRVNPKSKFCLDNLLTEHSEKKDHVKEYNEMKTELKNDGDFVIILNKQEEEGEEEIDLPEDQQKFLKQLTEDEETIPEDRPGMTVFDFDQYGCMFDESLHPCHCGFNVGESCSTIERHIHGITKEKYLMLVESDILSMSFARITCQNQLLRWLFFLMSFDDNFLVRQGCRKTILNVVHHQRVKGTKIWSPLVRDFITVLCNYGASLHSLLPRLLEKDFNKEILGLLEEEKTVGNTQMLFVGHRMGNMGNKILKQPNLPSESHSKQVCKEVIKEKLEMVLQILGSTLMKNREAHPSKELTLYIAVICKMSLDPIYKDLFGVRYLQDNIDMLLQNYSETDWQTQGGDAAVLITSSESSHFLPTRLKKNILDQTSWSWLYFQRITICRVLLEVAEHHHDMTYICKLIPLGLRGLYIQRRLAYLMVLKLLLNKNVTDVELHNFTIKDLYQFVPCMMTLLTSDLYKLSSIISLMDKCVASNHSLFSTDREELKKLIDLVKKIQVKDNVAMMNRSKVMNLIVRVTSCWTLDIQSFKGKQTKIFEYARYKSPVKIEQIKGHNSDVSEDSESDEDIPNKLPKLDRVESVT